MERNIVRWDTVLHSNQFMDMPTPSTTTASLGCSEDFALLTSISFPFCLQDDLQRCSLSHSRYLTTCEYQGSVYRMVAAFCPNILDERWSRTCIQQHELAFLDATRKASRPRRPSPNRRTRTLLQQMLVLRCSLAGPTRPVQ